MKIFWSLIAVLVVGLGVAFALPGGSDARAPSSGPAPGGRDRAVVPDMGAAMGPTAEAEPEAESAEAAGTPAVVAGSSAVEPGLDAADAAGPGETVLTDSGLPNSGLPNSVTENTPEGRADAVSNDTRGDALEATEVAFSELLASLSGEPLEIGADAAGAAADGDASAASGGTAGFAAGEDEAASGVEPARAPTLELRELPDGTTLVNERFAVAGDGSKSKPYEITWDYLTSARETYLPREGKTEIPPHIAMLEGKYVKIGGYLQFPLATPEPKELLVMLNQWDGCCIGIPPTPYDALEVSLTIPANQGERFAVEGSIVGRLTIDPYLVGDWLIGLYLIGDATLDVSGSRTAEEVYGNSPTVGDPNAMPGAR